jgi:hypothetical protein
VDRDLDHDRDDVADVVRGPQGPDRAHDGVADDDRAPDGGGAVVVVDVGRGEDESDADGRPADPDDRGTERSECITPIEGG